MVWDMGVRSHTMGWYGIKLSDPIPSGNGMVSISKRALSLYRQCASCIRLSLPLGPCVIPYHLNGMVSTPPLSHTDTVPWDLWDGISRGISHIFPTTRRCQALRLCGTCSTQAYWSIRNHIKKRSEIISSIVTKYGALGGSSGD